MRTLLRIVFAVTATIAAIPICSAELQTIERMPDAPRAKVLSASPASKDGSGPGRSFSADQIAKAAAQNAGLAGRATFGDGHQAGTKTLANGLFLSGNFSFQVNGSSVTLAADKITNSSTTFTTGTLRLELWATSAQPARGAGFNGYRLAVSPNISPLQTNSFYSNLFYTTSFTEPPAGTYWMVFVLSEFDSNNCTTSDHFCLQDSGVFPNQATFGQASGLLTIISQAGDQCYQNYPADGFALVQQLVPGMFQSYSPSVSCASLGMGVYAGTLATNSSVTVYTSSRNTAQLLCATGIITGCAVPLPSGPTYTDLWWNPAESGWGISLTHHPSGMIFAAWYTYDTNGNPKWYVVPSCPVVNNGCTGTLYQTHGPAFGQTFNPSLVTAQVVGTLSLQFVSATFATMTYTVNGVSGIEFIVRQPF